LVSGREDNEVHVACRPVFERHTRRAECCNPWDHFDIAGLDVRDVSRPIASLTATGRTAVRIVRETAPVVATPASRACD
jgi:hypothetical protein